MLEPPKPYQDNCLVASSEDDETLDLDLHPVKKLKKMSFEEDSQPIIRIVKPDTLRDEMEMEINEAAELTCLRPTSIRIMLNAFKWDKDKMMEKTMFGESFMQLRDIGIIINPVEPVNPPITPNAEIALHGSGACLLCRKPAKNVPQMVFTACDHWFCNRCFQGHLVSEIQIGDRSQFKCPFTFCMMFLDDELIRRLLPHPLSEAFEYLCLQDFVNCNRNRRVCPTEGCNRSSYCNVDLYTKFAEVNCDCGTSYCFGCGKLWHYPLTCNQLKRWLNLFAEVPQHSMLSSFKSYKKPCPHCSTSLENVYNLKSKICPTCDTRLCWSCLNTIQDAKSFSPRHSCSFDLYGKVQPLIVGILKVHHDYDELFEKFSMFSSNENEALEGKALNKNGNSKTGVELLRMEKVFDTIRKAQQLLRHSFAFAFFLQNSCNKFHYMKQLMKFEVAVENLMEYIHVRDMDDLASDIAQSECKVKNEQEKLLHVLSEGFENNLWSFRSTELTF